MDQNQKQQRGNRQFQGRRQRDENNDGIADQIADDRDKAAKKRDGNEQRRMRHVHCEKENRRQHRIDERDRDLRAHDGGEAAVKIAESRRNFIAASGVKIILHPMRTPVRVEASFQKEAPGCDDSEDAEKQDHRGAFGKISEVS